ncbi:MAG: SH3 domain-containing protein [Anaerolineaceae bacterium]|nr:SH3 domain-containing protein [Anaerolineaceae bacterium]
MKYIYALPVLILAAVMWLALSGVSPAQAQQVDCPMVVQTALMATQELCDTIGRNQACYGHVLLDAQSQPGWSLQFSNPGDKVDITGLRSLHLSALDVVSGVWGVTEMQLRANLPQSRPENLTLLMFGDVQVDNAVTSGATLDATANGPSNANVRLTPNQQGRVIATIAAHEQVVVLGRLADSSWLRIHVPDTDLVGWVFASLVTTAGDTQTLPIEEAGTPHFGPMQAFYFETGTDDQTACAEMPGSGFLIQTPEGAGEVNLLINEVNIHIGSTVYFEAQRNGEMTVTTLEGKARVEAMGVEHIAFAGSRVRVPMTDSLTPAGPPLPPEPYDRDSLMNLPIGLLKQTITVATPLTYDEIAQMYATTSTTDNVGQYVTGDNLCCDPANADLPECVGDNCDTSSATDTSDTCPTGNSCNTPGHDDDCVGNSCDAGTPPGKNK